LEDKDMTGKWEKSGRNVKENPPDFLVPWLICFTAIPVQRAKYWIFCI
jgi:hypothetical protein